jgi:superfamily II DNA or RNA helicase
LRDLIRAQTDLKNAIIFCNRKKDVADLYKSLDKHGFSVGALHGDMDQRSRTNMLQGFKDNEITLLVASDVAARGLDIPLSAMSSISMCRSMPRIMCTASAAPAAPVVPAPPSRWSRAAMPNMSTPSPS